MSGDVYACTIASKARELTLGAVSLVRSCQASIVDVSKRAHVVHTQSWSMVEVPGLCLPCFSRVARIPPSTPWFRHSPLVYSTLLPPELSFPTN